jgi:hypothetical protein
MPHRHPQYLELPLPVHTDGAVRRAVHARRHWLLIGALILLAILLIGVTMTGGSR